MIRLISLPNHQNSHKTRCPSLTNRSPSQEIKLGQRKRRLTVAQVAKNWEDLNLSHKNTTFQSIQNSSLMQRQNPKEGIEVQSITNKMKVLGLKFDHSKTRQMRAYTSYIFKEDSSVIKANDRRECMTKREVIKLKHPRAKRYSPIDKLLRLMESKQPKGSLPQLDGSA